MLELHFLLGQDERADKLAADFNEELKRGPEANSEDLAWVRSPAILLTAKLIERRYSPGDSLSESDTARIRAVIDDLKALRRALAPDSLRGPEIDNYISRCHIFLGDFDEGERLLREALKKPGAWASSNYRESNELLDEVLPFLRQKREGRLLLERGQYAEARDSFSQARKNLTEDAKKAAAERLNKEVRSIWREKSYAEAQAHFRRVMDETEGNLRLSLLTDYYIALADFRLGRLEAAEKSAREVLEAMEAVDDSRPDKDKVRALLELVGAKRLKHEAERLNAGGKFAEARELYSRVYSLLEQRLGLQDRETLSARYNVALMYELGGQTAAARNLYERLLPIQEKALGVDHQDVQTTRTRLAQLGAVRSVGGSLTMDRDSGGEGLSSAPADAAAYRKQLTEQEKKLGKDHPETLAIREKLADLLAAENEAAQAEKEYAAIVGLREKKQGREHLDTLKSKEKQALVLAAQGKPDQALNIYSQVLPIRERLQGPDHEDVEATLMGLVALYDQKGDSAAARTVTDRLQDIHDGKKLKDDPTAAPSSETTADMAAEFGSYKSALDGYERALAVKRRVLGPEDPATLAVGQKAAAMMYRLGDLAGAKAQHSAILEIRIRVLGPENPATLESKLDLASTCLALKDRNAAEKLLKEVLAVQERTLGPKHPDTLNTRQMLGH